MSKKKIDLNDVLNDANRIASVVAGKGTDKCEEVMLWAVVKFLTAMSYDIRAIREMIEEQLDC